MKITGPGQVSKSSSTKKSKAGSDVSRSAFGESLSEVDAPSTSGVAGLSATAPVDSLLHLQEVPDSTSGRSKGLLTAKDMLESLEDIRRGLLLGSIPIPNLKALARMVMNRSDQFDDPELTEILDEIELRARVELAKLGHDI
ncbi:MAG: hypothetical protein KAI28_02835 [Sphingomonadales bacterium]|nr:hypothetical protein [Sphingomonadales bacterium]